jgi:hypothetical protein
MWSFELSGFPFENRTAGVELAFYWWLCGRHHASEDRILFDFISLPHVRTLEALDGVSFDDFSDTVKSVTLYRDGHIDSDAFSLRFFRGGKGLRALAVLEGLGSEEERFNLRAEGDVDFTGYVVNPESLDTPIVDERSARSLLERFIDDEPLHLMGEHPPYLFTKQWSSPVFTD